MARYVLPVVGAVVGFIYGGPQGAMWGWSLGAAVGGLVDPQVIKGPSIGDLAQQTSQEGVPRPIVIGLSVPMSGNIIASAEPKIVKKTEGGKGGPKVKTESVFRTYAIRICEGPITAVLRVWRNNQLVYDARPGSSFPAAENAEFLKVARFFLGTFTQNPSPDLEAAFGVGSTPAHRGTCYMVMANEDLTDFRGAIPQFTFQVYNGTLSELFGVGSAWEWQEAAGLTVPPDPDTFPLPSSGFNTPAPQPFGIAPAGQETLGSQPIQSQWSPATHLWLRRSVNINIPVTGISIEIEAENSGFVWWDGEFIGAANPTNVQVPATTSGVLPVPSDLLDVGTHEVIVYGLDEASSEGAPENSHTYMRLTGTSAGAIPLAQVVAAICDRAGLESTMYDVSELDGFVAGITIVNTYPAFAALRSLSEVYFFAPSNYDGAIHFLPGGRNSVATISEDSMLDDDDGDIEQTERDDSIAVPRVMHLNYFDVDGGQATDKQTSERAGDRRSLGEMSMQSAIVMYADQAARVVAKNHKIAIEDLRGSLKFCLPDSFIGHVPADPVIVQYGGRSIRCRITRLDILEGYQQYEMLHDRQSAYTSNVEGIPAAPQTPPPTQIVGPTLIEPLDIHILRDVDDNLGLMYYVAVSGQTDAWTGALVELSLDGGLNYISSVAAESGAIMGELDAPLGDHPAEFPDEVNVLSVNILTPHALLEETTLTGMLNWANRAIVGDEIVQFANAEENTEGHWDLSLLLRGRKGTAHSAHAIGTRFVLLEPGSLGVIPASIVDLGRTLTFRATSFGEAEGSGTVVSMLYEGRSQIEREPAYVMAHLDGTDAVVSWQGVGRLGSGAQVAHGARFAGYRVEFDDGVAPVISVDTAAQELTQDVSSLSQPFTIRVMQLNELTGAGPAIEVIL